MSYVALLAGLPMTLTGPAPQEPQPARDSIRQAVLAAEAPVIATVSESGKVAILSAEDGEPYPAAPQDLTWPSTAALAVSSDGRTLAALNEKMEVQLVRWGQGEAKVRFFRFETDEMEEAPSFGRMEFSPAGDLLALPASDGGIRLLGLEGQELWHSEPLGGSWFDSPFAFAPSGRVLALLTTEGVSTMNARTGALIAGPFDLGDMQARSIALGPGGKRLAVGGGGHTLRVFDLTGALLWKQTARFPSDPFLDGKRSAGSVAVVVFSPNGDHIGVTTAESAAAAIFRADDGTQIAEGRFCGGRMGEPRGISWSADSTRMYHGFISGAMANYCLELQDTGGRLKALPEIEYEGTFGNGFIPQRGWKGCGVQLTHLQLGLVQMDTGEVLWQRQR